MSKVMQWHEAPKMSYTAIQGPKMPEFGPKLPQEKSLLEG